ncbi:MAG: HipA domain-containing protein [Alcanivoracaceae bacterium]|nr:HipA domain-containing protein [Alcanivoracaceae bacterium]
MSSNKIKNCPGTLAVGHKTYSNTCLRNVFNNKKVSHILPYSSISNNTESNELFIENRKRISISGVQEKLSLLLEKNKLRLTSKQEQGTYILKSIPRDLKNVDQVPANEHLSMQIARQVYKIDTAENAMVFFKDGAPAYITKRFDVKKDGSKYGIEDFASLAGKSKESAGDAFKYDYSYEELGNLIKKYVPAWRIEIEKFFSLLLFNYLINNGDGHLKNFSLMETADGDYIFSPAYDLLNTGLHIDDSSMALEKGLFANDYETKSYKMNGYYSYDDFFEFAIKIGIAQARAIKIIDKYRIENKLLEDLVSRSFLNKQSQQTYLDLYKQRLKALNYSFKKLI